VTTEDDERLMPLTDHLQELRLRLRNAALAVLITTGASYYFAEELFVWLATPMVRAWTEAGLGTPTLHFLSPIEPFWVYLKVSLIAGVFLASPLIFLQIWGFIAPGLYAKEKRLVWPFACGSAVCFTAGALFGYRVVFPLAFQFFLGYARTIGSRLPGLMGEVSLRIEPTISMDSYLGLMAKLLLGFGLVFELPLILTLLAIMGVVTARQLWRFNRIAVVLSFVVGAILTPGPDILSQVLMSAPLIALYNLSIGLAWLVERRRRSQGELGEAEEERGDGGGEARPH
jgi:sec-independent protein translocase protein TatC